MFNIFPLDDDGGRQDGSLPPAREQRHCRVARLVYVCAFCPTAEIRLKLRSCHARIRLLSLITVLTTAAIWLSAPTVAAVNR